MSNEYYPDKFPVPPFGIPMLTGPKGCGKTILSLNSPWGPVHTIDVEFSAYDYHENQEQMISQKIIRAPFTRAECTRWQEFEDEIARIETEKQQYGTIVLDTAGQLGTWITGIHFSKAESIRFSSGKTKAESQSQLVWGDIRTVLRDRIIRLRKHCKILILTAHQTRYEGRLSPRANPAVMELAALTIRLERDINSKYPNAMSITGRIPWVPTKIEKFTWSKFLEYFEKPVDLDTLKPEERSSGDAAPSTDTQKLTEEEQEQING